MIQIRTADIPQEIKQKLANQNIVVVEQENRQSSKSVECESLIVVDYKEIKKSMDGMELDTEHLDMYADLVISPNLSDEQVLFYNNNTRGI